MNRNVIGAIVGVQPFGGGGLSGTGPKAGGPLYLGRLVQQAPALQLGAAHSPALLDGFVEWLERGGKGALAAKARAYGAVSALGAQIELPGPVGERNGYALHPRGIIEMRASTNNGFLEQMAVVLATGDKGQSHGRDLTFGLPLEVIAAFSTALGEPSAAILGEGDAALVRTAVVDAAERSGPIITVHAERVGQAPAYETHCLLEEVVTSINTSAAGGNASLMMLGSDRSTAEFGRVRSPYLTVYVAA